MTTTRRDRWAEYAIADLRSAGTADSAIASANKLLAAEDERFGKPDDELRLARAHALEQETRAANAEMALKVVRADNEALNRFVAKAFEAELRASAETADATMSGLAACPRCVTLKRERDEARRFHSDEYRDRVERERVAAVPVGELRAALVCARESGSVAQLYDDVLRLVLPAEQRAAAAKPAEGGETGGA